MIFVTVGTHEQPFNRLIEEISGLRLNYLDGVPENGNIGFSVNYEKTCDYCKEFFAAQQES